jgi:hypothetical protein
MHEKNMHLMEKSIAFWRFSTQILN